MKRIFSILFALVLVLSMSLVTAASVGASPGPGLVGLWHLDEGIGSTAADSSGYGNHGTLSGGRFGNALSFDGIDDYVEVAHDASLEPSEITIEAWIYPLSWDHTPTAVALATKRTAYGNGYFLFWYASTSTINFDWGGSSGANRWNTGYNPPLNTWTHLAVTRSSAGRALYVNGALYSSTTHVGAPANVPTTSALRVGYDSFAARYPFKGSIDEVRISNVARTITPSDLTSPPSVDGNTVALWHFDESVGSTAYDETVNANDGTIYGASWVPAGPTWTSGMFGDALSFDGVDDYVGILDSVSLSSIEDGGTWELWIKPNSDLRAGKWIGFLDTAPGLVGAVQALVDPQNRLRACFGGVYGAMWSIDADWTGEWHHIVGTWNQKVNPTVTLYVDGVQKAQATPTVTVKVDLLHIGSMNYCSFDGIIDEVSIWDVALTPDEIAWLPPVTNVDFVLKDGTTLPLKFQVLDGDVLVTSPQWVSLEVTGSDAFTKTYMLGEGVENLRWNADGAYYIANLKTKDGDWPDGTYTANVEGIVTGTIDFDLAPSKGVGRGNSGK